MTFDFGRGTYLVFLCVWAGFVLALQWLVGAPELRARWRPVLVAALLSTLYLSAADRYALGVGIWQLNPDRTSGLYLLGLPLEEGLFFLFTNLMVAQSVALIMALGPSPTLALERLRRRIPSLRPGR